MIEAIGFSKESTAWKFKLMVCVIYDFLDFTVGRAMIVTPFLGEIVGCALCYAMFGKTGLLFQRQPSLPGRIGPVDLAVVLQPRDARDG